MKTLGLLETDVLYDDLQADFRSYGHLFIEFFQRYGVSLNYRFYQVQQGELPQPGDCDVYLITGSKAGVYDDLPWLAPLQAWIREAFARQEKIIGICFGHQLLAHTLGGFAGRSPKGWGIGVRTETMIALPDWLPDTPTTLTLIYSHRDQVERLPPQAIRMAGSEFCENAAFAIGDQVLAFQGHPEFTPAYTRRLLPRRETCVGSALLQQGLNSLERPTDAHRVCDWMATFIGARLGASE